MSDYVKVLIRMFYFYRAMLCYLNKVAVPCGSDSGSNLSVLTTMNEIKHLLVRGSILIF
jgi:hypothetical protein